MSTDHCMNIKETVQLETVFGNVEIKWGESPGGQDRYTAVVVSGEYQGRSMWASSRRDAVLHLMQVILDEAYSGKISEILQWT